MSIKTSESLPASITRTASDVGSGQRYRVVLTDSSAGVQVRSLTTTTGAGAVGTIQATADQFIQAARNKSVAGLLGARFASYGGGGVKVTIPRVSAGASASWVAEGSAPGSGTNPELDKVVLDPKRLTAFAVVTRKMLASAGPGLDAWLLADLAGALGAAIDASAFAGPGGNAPTGLLNNADVPVQSFGTDGAYPTRAALIAAVQAVANANGDASATASLGWATSPDGEARLRTIDGSTGNAGRWLWDTTGILDRPAFASTSLPNNLTKGSGTGLSPLIFGDFNALVINLPEAFDLVVDPYSIAPDVRFTIVVDVAVAVRRPTAFVKFVDMKTS